MPKTKTGKNVKVERIGEPVDLVAWLNETVTGEDGKVTPKNVSADIFAELSKGKQTTSKVDGVERVTEIRSENYVLNIEISKRKLPNTKEGKHYDTEYANILPLTGDGCTYLVGGKLDPWYEKNKAGDDKEMPSLTKYFAQGFSMVARNAASTRIQAAVEGPDKMLNQTISRLMKQRKYSLEKATAKAKAMMALLDDE